MSGADYLTRLSARTLGVVPVVQPQAGPLFDPSTAGRADIAETDDTGGALPETLSSNPATQPSRPRADTPRVAPEPMVAANRPPVGAYAARPDAPVDGQSTPLSVMTEDRPASPPRIETHRAADRMPPPAADVSGERLPPAPLVSSAADRVEHDAAAEARSPAAPAFPAVRQVVARPVPAPQPAEVANIEPKVGPTIRVTIGRVELRAMIEPPRAPRANTRKSALMSLDDYLKQGRS